MTLDALETLLLDHRVKGMPGGIEPFPLGRIAERKWNVLREDLPCSPCFERICPLGHLKCLTTLSPDRVWTSLSDVMAKAG